MHSNKTWIFSVFTVTLVLLLCAGLFTGIVDPLFHFHAPLGSLEYPINNQRYQNDGIVKHFPYDAIITGTSLTENFKTSEFDALYGTKAVKVCYSGGTFDELIGNLRRAIDANADIRYILIGLDEWHLLSARVFIEADGAYPTYLYDENPFNDVEYLLNKEVLINNTLQVLDYTKRGNTTTSFDVYSSWEYPTGQEAVLKDHVRTEKKDTAKDFNSWEAGLVYENIQNKLLPLANDNPQIQFLCFFPPYSIVNWDDHSQRGDLVSQIETFRLASELLLEAENVSLYSFYTDYETITNLDNYRDNIHYHSQINSLLLQRMFRGEYLLTRENYESHWQQVLDYYQSYDYDAIYDTP